MVEFVLLPGIIPIPVLASRDGWVPLAMKRTLVFHIPVPMVVPAMPLGMAFITVLASQGGWVPSVTK